MSPPAGGARAEKAGIRRRMLAARLALGADERRARSARVAARVAELPAWRSARRVHAYVGAVGGEVETEPLLQGALARGVEVVCPRVEGREIASYRVDDLAGLVPGPRGLREPSPDPARLVDPSTFDLVLVPGLAFDRAGGRIGFGAGYYDRFLAGLADRTATVGLAFSLQLLDRVPQTEADVPVDWIVTEREAIDGRSARRELEPDP